MSDRPKNHGYAALAREDVEDARRGRPTIDLDGYAAQRGLEFRGRGRLAGFRRALPAFEEEQHNLMRGVLPGGRFGVLLHELLHTHGPDGVQIQGKFFRVKTSAGPGLLRSLIPDRTDIPVIGAFLDPKADDSPREAFDTQGAWAPATTVGIPVPETVSRVDGLHMIVASRAGWISTARNLDLEELGVPGWRANPGTLEPDVLPRLLGGPVAQALSRLTDLPYADVTIDHGMLMVTRNGYLTDPAALDAFAETVSALAAGIGRACLDGRRPVPFDHPLAACPWTVRDPKAVWTNLPKAWEDDFRGYAERHGMTLEDPRDWHERFPSVPVPGRALAVMRHPAGHRVLFTTELPVGHLRAVRGVVAYATDAEDTPPGGIHSAEAGTTTAVHQGTGVVWTHRFFGYTSEADSLADELLAPAV